MAQDIPQLIADARTLLATLPYQATERLTLLAIVEQLEKTHAALTPSADTKAAYMHGFQFDFPAHDADGVKCMFTPNIPWVAIEKIMAAILAQAAVTTVSQSKRPDDDALEPHLPEHVQGARRCGIQRSAWLPGWFVGWSPRNDNENAEGPWSDWVALARAILATDAEAQTKLQGEA
jgi:hypothetical protein